MPTLTPQAVGNDASPWHAKGMAIWPTLRHILIETEGLGDTPASFINAIRVRDQVPRCSQIFCIGAAKCLALEHLAGGKSLAHY